MTYKEINMQNLATTLKKLLDDPEVTSEELYELILLTVGENINTHREVMDKSKTLRNKLMSDDGVSGFKSFTPDTISFGSAASDFSSYSNDYINFNNDDTDHNHHYYKFDRNK